MVAKFFSAEFANEAFGLETPFGFLEMDKGFSLNSFFKGWGYDSSFEWPPRPL